MKPIQYTWLLVFLLAWTSGFGQLKDANRAYEHFAYQNAIKKYLRILKRNPNSGDAMYNLANSYRLNGEVQKAEHWFEKAMVYDGRPEATLYFGQMLLINGRYARAQRAFERYSGLARSDSDRDHALDLAKRCERLEADGIQQKQYVVEKVEFNSKKLDFSPAWYKDSQLVFVSNRKGSKGVNGTVDPWTGDDFVDLFAVDYDRNGNFGEPVSLKGNLNSRYHEGPAVFSKDGNLVYFTRSDYMKKRGFDEERNTRLKIFRGELIEEKWVVSSDLEFNDNEFSCAHPALAPDGSYLVFSSDRPGGYGGMDLYVVERKGRNWSEPKNLGREINTAGNEVFPFLDKKETLYFSSDMHPGIGGLDVFSAAAGNQVWLRPVHMGAPLNSPRDDFGLIVDGSGNMGYFSSNRDGNDDDIYHFERANEQDMRLQVVDCSTGEPVEGATVVIRGNGFLEPGLTSDEDGLVYFRAPFELKMSAEATKEGYGVNGDCPGKVIFASAAPESEITHQIVVPIASDPGPFDPNQRMISGVVLNSKYRNPVPFAKIRLVNPCTGEVLEVVADVQGRYVVPANTDCDYVVQADRENFKPSIVPVSLLGKPMDEDVEQDIELVLNEDLLPGLLTGDGLLEKGMIIELEHIYFDYDKSYIRPDAIPELKDVLELMRKYPRMRGEIGAHTDSRASFEYNIDLSQRRAESAVRWLTMNGVDRNRLIAKGYGESRLLNRCADGEPCGEKDHQRNRRVEFKVLELDGKAIWSEESEEYQ